MQAFRDGSAIRAAAASVPDVELADLITRRVQELSEYEDCDLGKLVNVFVIEPGDTLQDIDRALGFVLTDRPIDIVEAHLCWYELTIVLRDDGFGVVLYVPTAPGVDPDLLALCRSRAPMQERP
jgi:hypothetical protein